MRLTDLFETNVIRLGGSRPVGADKVTPFLDEFEGMTLPHPWDGDTRYIQTGAIDHEIVMVSLIQTRMTGNPNETVYLTGLTVPEENRRKGAATEMMTLICKLADKHKVNIFLIAEPMNVNGKRMSSRQLIKFYEKFGFEFNGMDRGTRHAVDNGSTQG